MDNTPFQPTFHHWNLGRALRWKTEDAQGALRCRLGDLARGEEGDLGDRGGAPYGVWNGDGFPQI